jgi:hypothetical protein
MGEGEKGQSFIDEIREEEKRKDAERFREKHPQDPALVRDIKNRFRRPGKKLAGTDVKDFGKK